MQEEVTGSVYRKSSSWELDGPSFVFHYEHVLEGVTYDGGCGGCRNGLASFRKTYEETISPVDVPESGGIDEEGATAFSQRDGWYRGPKGQLPGPEEADG